MEELFDEASAEHHLAAQRERGAHHPEFLTDPIGLLKDDEEGDDGECGQPAPRSPKPSSSGPSGAARSVVASETPGTRPGEQGTLVDGG
jgi:hypothetical protein